MAIDKPSSPSAGLAFRRFRPQSHFIAPHSWANDPCGAVYIPETREYLVCYQWNPGTSQGGNCAWGAARSRDLVTWEDCAPALCNGPAGSYDALGVFSGSIVSRLEQSGGGGKRVLYLFYTSVSHMPIHWSRPYQPGCETQSVAVSRDLGRSWERHQRNPLISLPPRMEATTGWRDPFVSPWASLSELRGVSVETMYMMIASGEHGRGSQLHLYTTEDLLGWTYLGVLLDVKQGEQVQPDSYLTFGMNFECGTFATVGGSDYIILGVEEDVTNRRHNCHYEAWLGGKVTLAEDGTPKFVITNHGLLDHGVLYAAHLFRGEGGRLLQLGWADETASPAVVKAQGWAGCMSHPRELFEITRPVVDGECRSTVEWEVDEARGLMTTLGIRPAEEVASLRRERFGSSMRDLERLQSTNYEIEATLSNITGPEVFALNVRQAPDDEEVTQIIVNLREGRITIDRSRSSLAGLGTGSSTLPDSGPFATLPGEDEVRLRVFVDGSLIEVFANNRFALTSRVYPSLDESLGASCVLSEGYEEGSVAIAVWEGLKGAWPQREAGMHRFEDLHPLRMTGA
ncbi:Beta-fructofuranosidase [Purpureocillium takamizusanense]|uniref:Beta-fructofuranosidase n=1 Tax=Purpureocillium takamizusanense TaxID=2060973 RepID=A0A9Q8QRC4_9HYPO|nr:Beta-fructofuranosidase [Purpureocillium takamizusanense]UNI23891.1 Beta-fructofuranosidase [Purpureocillium takamizusanense]